MCSMSPRFREHMKGALKGFNPDELEPRTSDGELVADLLASAGAQFESGSQRSRGSSSARSASLGAGAAPRDPVIAHSCVQSPSCILRLGRFCYRLAAGRINTLGAYRCVRQDSACPV